MEKFFQMVSQFTPLSSASERALTTCIKKLELPKGTILVPENTVGCCLYLIERGLARTFYLKDGKDVTSWFSAESSFACSVISFITRQPDRRSIELLENSVLYSLHFNDMENLCNKHHEIEMLFRKIVSFSMVEMLQKVDALHFSSALQRYQAFMSTHPTIIQRAPLGMIASYLGIAQETLSRIRAQI